MRSPRLLQLFLPLSPMIITTALLHKLINPIEGIEYLYPDCHLSGFDIFYYLHI